MAEIPRERERERERERDGGNGGERVPVLRRYSLRGRLCPRRGGAFTFSPSLPSLLLACPPSTGMHDVRYSTGAPAVDSGTRTPARACIGCTVFSAIKAADLHVVRRNTRVPCTVILLSSLFLQLRQTIYSQETGQ